MNTQFNPKSAVAAVLQWLGAVIAFLISLIIGSMILPLSKTIMDATPPTGIFTSLVAQLFSAVICATILVWAARRSSFKGLAAFQQKF